MKSTNLMGYRGIYIMHVLFYVCVLEKHSLTRCSCCSICCCEVSHCSSHVQEVPPCHMRVYVCVCVCVCASNILEHYITLHHSRNDQSTGTQMSHPIRSQQQYYHLCKYECVSDPYKPSSNCCQSQKTQFLTLKSQN